ncbi:MAG: PAS domain S-box protein [Cyclobacteriaceae bacterium]|nr:PAS domain S-box protein [Cyclobacteriaceae bacterium]
MQKHLEITFNSAETFREIFQGSAEGILMINDAGDIQLANPVSERMFGYETGELVGKKLEVLLPERYRSQHVQHRVGFKENPAPRRMGVGRDLMARRKDGNEFPVEVSLSYKEINHQLVVVAFIIDITERKKVEEALKHSEEQLLIYASELEKKVKTRTDDLNKLVEDLERANHFLQEQIVERKKAEEETKKALDKERELNELKTKFVSIASHEFRTPLSSVLSSASLIHQYKTKGDFDKIDKHVQRIKSSVNHLTAILNDFLSLGKLEEGRIEVVREEICLKSFFEEILEELRPLLKEGQTIELTCDLEKDEYPLDKRVLRNILFNLLSNASKYSHPHKVIHFDTRLVENSHLEVIIRDEGIGIPESEAKHLFERFFRASNVSNIQGTGLGLNIVKRYVDLLKGTIDFSSIEGKGSTFTITLPLT